MSAQAARVCLKVPGRHGLGAFGAKHPGPSAERLGQQEFDIMKKLLIAASMAAGLAAGAMPAFAQSATTSQYPADPQNYDQAPRYAQAPHYAQAPNDDPPAATSGGPKIGTGLDPDYQMQQQELEHTPGYNPTGGGD
jgi:hypothetical protein